MITQQQLQNRRNGIGASDAAAILGIDPWKTPLEVFLDKVGIAEETKVEFGTPLYWGNILEDSVARAYSDCTGEILRKSLVTLIHPGHHFIMCHLDRKIEGKRKILECKTSHMAMGDKWGDVGTEHAPLNYIVQVQHQMAVTGYEEADIAVLIGGSIFRYYTIKRDEEIITKIIEEECKFWNGHVLTLIAPPCINKGDVKLLFRQDDGEAIDATDEIAESIEKLIELKETSKNTEKEKSELEDRIALFMKGASIIQYYGKQLATWKADKNGRRSFRIKGTR